MRGAWLAVWLLAAPLPALETLRLPWIFSDLPELSADFFFSVAPEGKTRVELALGGRFSRFGLPSGAARAPRLDLVCEIQDPSDAHGQKIHLHSVVDLGEVIESYGRKFSPEAFSRESLMVFKTDFKVQLAPGDYNVKVSLRDVELSIASSRTLHLIVPVFNERAGVGDLRFCLGVGESLDTKGRTKRLLDANPWRQLGGHSGWDLIVAYDLLPGTPTQGLMRRHSIWRLRGNDDMPVWSEEGKAPQRQAGQVFLARVDTSAVQGLRRGTYLFKVECWTAANAKKPWVSSKTFEVLP